MFEGYTVVKSHYTTVETFFVWGTNARKMMISKNLPRVFRGNHRLFQL